MTLRLVEKVNLAGMDAPPTGRGYPNRPKLWEGGVLRPIKMIKTGSRAK